MSTKIKEEKAHYVVGFEPIPLDLEAIARLLCYNSFQLPHNLLRFLAVGLLTIVP